VQRLHEGITDRVCGVAGETEHYTFEHAGSGRWGGKRAPQRT
jgi:hypothetical protein